MRKFLFVFLIGLCILATPRYSYAHAPRSIKAMYNSQNNTLKVIVGHIAQNPLRHYIKRIEIMQDGTVIGAKDFRRQNIKISQIAIFKLTNINPNNAVVVVAYCNVGGELKKTLNLSSI